MKNLLSQYKGTIRHLAFLAFIFIFSLLFGKTILALALKYYEPTELVAPDYSFASFLVTIIASDFIACVIKLRNIKQRIAVSDNYLNEDKSIYIRLQGTALGLAVFFNIIPTIMAVSIIINAIDIKFIQCLLVVLVMVKWVGIGIYITYIRPEIGATKKEKRVILKKIIPELIPDTIITLTSVVLYTITWQLFLSRLFTINSASGRHSTASVQQFSADLILMFILATFIYVPLKFIFIAEDYYCPDSNEKRKVSVFTGLLVILVIVVGSVMNV